MASRFWVGGTGNWDGSTTTHWAAISGGAGGQSVPTSSDTVTFDTLSNATAYTVTVTATANCSDLTIGAPLTGKVTFAGVSALNVFGSMNLSGGTAGITFSYNGLFTFKSTATGKTLTFNGVSLPGSFGFDGVGGGWTLQDALTSSQLTLTNGSLDTNGVSLTVSAFVSTAANTRVLTLGASNITITTSWNVNSSGLTFNANTSTITCTGFTGSSLTYNNVIMNSSASNVTIDDGGNTFANLTNTGGTSASLAAMTLAGNQTVTGLLTLNGISATARILIRSNTVGTARTITSASNSITNTDFQDITGAGAASWNLSAVSGGSGDCGGNTGITFTVAADQHWTNASSGSWSASGNWTSRVPLPQDNVFMDKAFGTSQTVTADMPRLGKSIDWTGATWTTALTFTPSIANAMYGSLTLISGLTYTSAAVILTLSGRGTFTLTTNTVTIDQPITVNAITGTLTLGGNLTLGITRRLSITNGTLTIVNGGSNYVISTGLLTLNGGTLTLGSAIHLITGTGTTTWNVTSGTLNPNTSTIKINDTSNTAITFVGGSKTYNNVWFARAASTASNTISGSNTFADFKDNGSIAHSILFTDATTQTITTFTVNGTAGNLITINSTTTATHSLVKSGGGTISCDYLSVQHSVATPVSTWYAGANSTNNQAVATAGSGWVFTIPPTGNTNSFLMFM